MPTISLAPLALAIFLIALVVAKRTGGFWGRLRGLAIVGSVVLFGLVVAYNALTIVRPGTVKVEVLLGKVRPTPLLPGPYWTNPQSHFTEMETRRRVIDLTGDNAVEARAKDGRPVRVSALVAYALQPDYAPEIFNRFGADEVYGITMTNAAKAAVADSIAAMPMIEAQGAGREALAADIQARFGAAVRKQLVGAGMDDADAAEAFLILPVLVDGVSAAAEPTLTNAPVSLQTPKPRSIS
jgi:regulator of protease activity HflC (stomatin/prohibitin superfamily)